MTLLNMYSVSSRYFNKIKRTSLSWKKVHLTAVLTQKAPISVTDRKDLSKMKLSSWKFSLNFFSFMYNNMYTYNTMSSHTDRFRSAGAYNHTKKDSEESLLTFVNLFPFMPIPIVVMMNPIN